MFPRIFPFPELLIFLIRFPLPWISMLLALVVLNAARCQIEEDR